MAQEDKLRWDAKYKNNPIPNSPIALVTQNIALAKGNKALDIACGMGRHSKYLASAGFEVDALDISSVAIASLKNIPHIQAKEVDFDTYTLSQNSYDLIVCTYFLKRLLFPQIVNALKKDGIFIYETFLYHPENEKAPSERTFLLEKGELENAFSETCELLHISEYWDTDINGTKTMKASMVARKKCRDRY